MVYFLSLALLLPPTSNLNAVEEDLKRRTLHFMQGLRQSVRAKAGLPDWSEACKVDPVRTTDQDGNEYVVVEHSFGRVFFNSKTGSLAYAILRRQGKPLDKPLTQEECAEIALTNVRNSGWSGELKVDPRNIRQNAISRTDPGFYRFEIQPVFEGIPFDVGSSFKVEVDATNGLILFFDGRVPRMPSFLKLNSTPNQAEGIAVQNWSRKFKSYEFYFTQATELVIVRPPRTHLGAFATFKEKVALNEGIPAYRVSFETPSNIGDGFRDWCVYWIDAETDKIVSGAGGLAEHLMGEKVPLVGKRFYWPSQLQPFIVSGSRGSRSAFGGIQEDVGKLSSNTKEIKLRTRDRLLVAKFDSALNLLQVGSHIGRPTGHLAEVLRAVTR